MRLQRLGTALILSVVVVGLIACSDDDGAASPASSEAADMPATTTTLARFEFAGGAAYVSGTTEGFSIDEGTVTDDGGGVSHSRDGTVRYRLVSDDPRVAGEVVATWNTDRWGVADEGALVQWGTSTLTNDGGTWECDYAGAYASPVGDHIARWWQGTDGYEGLTFYMWVVPSAVGSAQFEWKGVIFPGEPPPGAGG